ncbi:hypothetical protein D9758_003675 [Tetrapyrgos nigripes]|uniref:Uncharacterized protein n=1 Tax=Tetrapyrgos nigripes TaxID=182062 RepID=A0A8H5LS64_9AGAR|nr:hypothetical protein D9758_003675 [Tetrapyrgos nigripes]
MPTYLAYLGRWNPSLLLVNPSRNELITALRSGGQISAAALKTFDPTNGTSLSWTVDIAAGIGITLQLRDSTGTIAYSNIVTTQSSSDSSCLSSSTAGSAASGSSSASGSPTSALTTSATIPATRSSASATSASGIASRTGTSATSAASASATNSASRGVVLKCRLAGIGAGIAGFFGIPSQLDSGNSCACPPSMAAADVADALSTALNDTQPLVAQSALKEPTVESTKTDDTAAVNEGPESESAGGKDEDIALTDDLSKDAVGTNEDMSLEVEEHDKNQADELEIPLQDTPDAKSLGEVKEDVEKAKHVDVGMVSAIRDEEESTADAKGAEAVDSLITETAVPAEETAQGLSEGKHAPLNADSQPQKSNEEETPAPIVNDAASPLVTKFQTSEVGPEAAPADEPTPIDESCAQDISKDNVEAGTFASVSSTEEAAQAEQVDLPPTLEESIPHVVDLEVAAQVPPAPEADSVVSEAAVNQKAVPEDAPPAESEDVAPVAAPSDVPAQIPENISSAVVDSISADTLSEYTAPKSQSADAEAESDVAAFTSGHPISLLTADVEQAVPGTLEGLQTIGDASKDAILTPPESAEQVITEFSIDSASHGPEASVETVIIPHPEALAAETSAAAVSNDILEIPASTEANEGFSAPSETRALEAESEPGSASDAEVVTPAVELEGDTPPAVVEQPECIPHPEVSAAETPATISDDVVEAPASTEANGEVSVPPMTAPQIESEPGLTATDSEADAPSTGSSALHQTQDTEAAAVPAESNDGLSAPEAAQSILEAIEESIPTSFAGENTAHVEHASESTEDATACVEVKETQPFTAADPVEDASVSVISEPTASLDVVHEQEAPAPEARAQAESEVSSAQKTEDISTAEPTTVEEVTEEAVLEPSHSSDTAPVEETTESSESRTPEVEPEVATVDSTEVGQSEPQPEAAVDETTRDPEVAPAIVPNATLAKEIAEPPVVSDSQASGDEPENVTTLSAEVEESVLSSDPQANMDETINEENPQPTTASDATPVVPELQGPEIGPEIAVIVPQDVEESLQPEYQSKETVDETIKEEGAEPAVTSDATPLEKSPVIFESQKLEHEPVTAGVVSNEVEESGPSEPQPEVTVDEGMDAEPVTTLDTVPGEATREISESSSLSQAPELQPEVRTHLAEVEESAPTALESVTAIEKPEEIVEETSREPVIASDTIPTEEIAVSSITPQALETSIRKEIGESQLLVDGPVDEAEPSVAVTAVQDAAPIANVTYSHDTAEIESNPVTVSEDIEQPVLVETEQPAQFTETESQGDLSVPTEDAVSGSVADAPSSEDDKSTLPESESSEVDTQDTTSTTDVDQPQPAPATSSESVDAVPVEKELVEEASVKPIIVTEDDVCDIQSLAEHDNQPSAVHSVEIERPKSPWTPSYSVSKLGPDVAVENEIEEVEEAPIAEETSQSQSTPQQDTLAEIQGSPLPETRPLADDPSTVELEGTEQYEGGLYQDHEPASDEQLLLICLMQEITEPTTNGTEPPESTATVDETTFCEQSDPIVEEDHPTSTSNEHPEINDIADEDSRPDEKVWLSSLLPSVQLAHLDQVQDASVSTETEQSSPPSVLELEVEESSPLQQSIDVADSVPVSEPSTVSGPTPTTNETAVSESIPNNVSSAGLDIAEAIERPKSPWTPSYSVTSQGPNIVSENDIPEISELPPAGTQDDVPVIVEPASSQSETEKTTVEAETSRPSSPYIPSYSTSVQGGNSDADVDTTAENQEASQDDDLAATQDNQASLSQEPSDQTIDSTQDVTDKAPEPVPVLTEPPSEDVPADPKSNNEAEDVHIQPAEPEQRILSTGEPPVERPKSPYNWTPSYSVTQQGKAEEPSIPESEDDAEEVSQLKVTAEVGLFGFLNIARADSLCNSHQPVSQTEASQIDDASKEIANTGAVVEPTAPEDAKLQEDKAVFPTTHDNGSQESLTSLDTVDPKDSRSRARLESTTSSLFFPGGWFSKAPPASLDTTHGEGVFTSSKPNSPTDETSGPEDTQTATAAEAETQTAAEEKKSRWKKTQGISTGALFDLKGEAAKHEQEAARNKALGSGKSIVGRERPAKKPTVWSRQNAGVDARAARDLEDVESKRELESARPILERKAKKYKQLKRGKGAGLSEEQINTLLVNTSHKFDKKGIESRWESDSDDVDDSLPLEDDPEIDYVDELGRDRRRPLSEIPRHLLPDRQKESEEVDEDEVIHNPVNYFPVFDPTAERVEKISKEFAEENTPPNVHYNADREVREKGAGYMKFSGDEETRRGEMERLNAARDETKEIRQKTGAVDVRPGEVEGMRADESMEGPAKSRGTEKRKRELEERKRAIAAKRRKVLGVEKAPENLPQSSDQTEGEVPIFMAAAPSAVDPFAVLETSVQGEGKGKAKAKAALHDDADAFLASVEKDITFRQS